MNDYQKSDFKNIFLKIRQNHNNKDVNKYLINIKKLLKKLMLIVISDLFFLFYKVKIMKNYKYKVNILN